MRSASIISLILAAVLIVVGVIICVIAGNMASKDPSLDLYADRIDADGDAVNVYSLEGKNAKNIVIDLKRAHVNVIGGADRSRVEVVNYPSKAYDYWVSDGTVHIKDATVWSIFTNIRISESGFGFTGLRHYLNLGAYKDKVRVINIYLSAGDRLSAVDIDLDNGDVSLSDISPLTTCDVAVANGSVSMVNVTGEGKATVSAGTGGIEMVHCRVKESVLSITGQGDITAKIDYQHSFTLETLGGEIKLDGESVGGQYSGVYPSKPVVIAAEEPAQTGEEAAGDGQSAEGGDGSADDAQASDDSDSSAPETEKSALPMIVKADVKIGDIIITVG